MLNEDIEADLKAKALRGEAGYEDHPFFRSPTVREVRILAARRAIAGQGEVYWYLKRLKSEELGAIAETVVDALFEDSLTNDMQAPSGYLQVPEAAVDIDRR
ncbi:MAG TPA: hypothetical protein VH164_03055 [Ktedonobacteraceae bacterium]|jgi:hypothetical protein|nr:hypothetical protein [Ktedonobacteraceae bacterium]